MKKTRIGLVGITGYTGMELARLLATHPHMELSMACSRTESGKRLGAFYPFLEKLPGSDLAISVYNPDIAKEACDIVFLAVPHGKAMEMAGELVDRGVKVVDLSADFRIRDAAVYEAWYKVEHTRKDLLPKAVYGLPELYAEEVKRAQLVANPGCYPTSAILALYPALSKGLVLPQDIVVDSKSGTTGAGRKPVVGSLFCEVYDSFKAYNLGKHRHTPEIEQEVSRFAGLPVALSFNTHLVPMNRGILTTVYTKLANPSTSLDEVHDAYMEAYADKPWIRVLPKGSLPETRNVRGSMFCDMGLVVDPRTKRLLVVSAIDNICRGASGQALANANLMSGLDVAEGLEQAPMLP
ncbi:MAG: N-acetyl-gamma-glutamyl-phosphate reductase [Desulfovibrio sp.]|jgi:N-acetyl-gamma-glutamyl-phosphate reductase|nr:N-acetyl-gamma-glutamyl-phosphate reductase [Desulfovibrio sp.]MBQ1539571.1 N-acetyl-gamma-glutamyl-phosphate reductase [Desulfovibrio sp.]MBQ2476217.1 N-acetyl-gamma-glutamyl-phosphate reductase [Desulfovibrio sp.]